MSKWFFTSGNVGIANASSMENGEIINIKFRHRSIQSGLHLYKENSKEMFIHW